MYHDFIKQLGAFTANKPSHLNSYICPRRIAVAVYERLRVTRLTIVGLTMGDRLADP